MDLVPRLVFTRMLHKGFCSTFQYPCSWIFFILYRFIFFSNPQPPSPTDQFHQNGFFPKLPQFRNHRRTKARPDGGIQLCCSAANHFSNLSQIKHKCSTLFQPFSGFNKHKISTLFKPASGLITKFQPLFKSFSGFISDFLHFIKHKFSTLFIKNCLHYKEALRPPLHWLALL